MVSGTSEMKPWIWGKIHWFDESHLLLNMTDGRTRVSCLEATKYCLQHPGNHWIWSWFWDGVEMRRMTVGWTWSLFKAILMKQHIRKTSWKPLSSLTCNYALATKPEFMDNNARPHRTCAVMDVLQWNEITTIPWLSRSPDLYPVVNLWDIVNLWVCQRPPLALHQECRIIPQRQIQRLVQGMGRWIESVIYIGRVYTRYWTSKYFFDTLDFVRIWHP